MVVVTSLYVLICFMDLILGTFNTTGIKREISSNYVGELLLAQKFDI